MGTWPVIKPSAAGAYDEPIRFGCSPGPGRHGSHAHFGAQGIPVTPTKMPERDLCVAGRVVRIAGPRQPRKGAIAMRHGHPAKILWLGAAGGPGHYPPTWWARLGLLHDDFRSSLAGPTCSERENGNEATAERRAGAGAGTTPAADPMEKEKDGRWNARGRAAGTGLGSASARGPRSWARGQASHMARGVAVLGRGAPGPARRANK